jgi:heme/copper-type cytochrome/quinol oxidase subunit 2
MKKSSRDGGISTRVMAVITVIVFGAGIFAGFLFSYGPLAGISGAAAGSGTGVYDLNLVITTNNWYNNTIGYQPAYFVVHDGKLYSSASITIPANVPIAITIVNYDSGAAIVASQFANVTGTQGGNVFLVNDTNVNSTAGATGTGILVHGGVPISSVPSNAVAHTFTIFLNGKTVVNIPVMPSSTEFATFVLSPGVYHWQCEALCGSGHYGDAGAMLSTGWMNGVLKVG